MRTLQITPDELRDIRNDAKQEALKIATNSRGANPHDDMTGYGSDWPGTMKDQMKDEPAGTDPAEIFEQLELFPEAMRDQIKQLMIAHSPSGTYDEYGRPREAPPWEGYDPSGNPITIPWLKEYYQKQHPNREQLHNQKYHGDVSQVNYGKNMPQGYRDWSKQLKEIMGTKGSPDFLKELQIHTRNYPKA